LDEVTVHAAHDVLMKVDNNSVLTVGNPTRDFRPVTQASPNARSKYNFSLLITNKIMYFSNMFLN